MHACMHVCVYMYVCMYVCIYVCMHVCVRAYARTYIRMRVYMYECGYVCIYGMSTGTLEVWPQFVVTPKEGNFSPFDLKSHSFASVQSQLNSEYGYRQKPVEGSSNGLNARSSQRRAVDFKCLLYL